MYYPIQIPHLLSTDFAKYIAYSETVVPTLQDFSIYVFEAYSRTVEPSNLAQIILTQGTIDLGFDLVNKWIGYGGLSQTDYQFMWEFPFRNFGVRLKPGAFHQLTGIDASSMMDQFLPLSEVDGNFDEAAFFSLSYEEAKVFLIDYVRQLTRDHTPNRYTLLFDELAEQPPTSTLELYQLLGYSSRQCQRIFAKHYGLTPKMVLTVLRFQKCLRLLTTTDTTASDVIESLNYYDQAHFTQDFKRHIGLTPRALIELFKVKDK
ncbi:MAG: AraC family transcriptional regulator [Oscillospiraceae bacterium]|nr:AraC family transcriptional regulator [Oscillospiraceae bacterium]